MKFGKLKLKETGKPKAREPRRKQKQPQIQQIFKEELKIKDKVTTYEPEPGSGLIFTSGSSIHGEQTKFKTELQKEDYIILQHPVSKEKQERRVMIIFGDKSIMLQEPFTAQFTTFTPYEIRKKTKIQIGQDVAAVYQQKLQQINRTKPISKPIMNVRVKKGVWSYETKKVEVEDKMSKQELLNIRQKMGKDKFCW